MNQVVFMKDRLSRKRRAHISARLLAIWQRYGFGARKMAEAIFSFTRLAQAWNTVPTFPITASLLKNFGPLVRQLQATGADFAIHGYEHIDYTLISEAEFRAHLTKSIRLFEENEIEFSGFRFPFLKRSARLLEILAENNLAWDSSVPSVHHSLNRNDFQVKNWKVYEFMLKDYQNSFSHVTNGVPQLNGGLLELPVSLPDDDLLVDRLLTQDEDLIALCWVRMLKTSLTLGDLFVLQLHPERFFLCANALELLLKTIGQLSPAVWLASLSQINEWWRERSCYDFAVQPVDEFGFQVEVSCSPRAEVLIKNLNRRDPQSKFPGNYTSEKRRRFTVECPMKPMVGIPQNLNLKSRQYLKNEGYAFEIARPVTNYSVLVRDPNLAETALSQALEETVFPLLRIWRWPSNARCAFSISGDVDCLTVGDFLNRFREN